jgi:ERCC4 domain
VASDCPRATTWCPIAWSLNARLRPDLAASIKDRRLFEQLARLADAYPSVVLIVEGDPVHMHQAAWQGAFTLGASVLRTTDRRATAEWIARLHRLEGKPASRPRGAPRVRRPTDADLQNAEDVLRCPPGISTVEHAFQAVVLSADRHRPHIELRHVTRRVHQRVVLADIARPAGHAVLPMPSEVQITSPSAYPCPAAAGCGPVTRLCRPDG